MLGDFLTRCLVLILGYAYPAFECFKAVEKNKVQIDQLRFWCQYWIIIAFYTAFERIGDIFISWLPMYGEMKLVLIVYLWYPKTMGTNFVYGSLLRPYVAKHETDIDRKVEELRARAVDTITRYWQYFTQHGQTTVAHLLHSLAAQSAKFTASASTAAATPPHQSQIFPPPQFSPPVYARPYLGADRSWRIWIGEMAGIRGGSDGGVLGLGQIGDGNVVHPLSLLR